MYRSWCRSTATATFRRDVVSYGHPVLSMWRTDIVVYGSDLASYIDREFGVREDGDVYSVQFESDVALDTSPELGPPLMVEFWRDYV